MITLGKEKEMEARRKKLSKLSIFKSNTSNNLDIGWEI